MSEQPGRYQRSPGGMIGAMLVLLVVIGGYVALRSLTSNDLSVEPERVDYLGAVRAAQSGDWEVAYPASLPSGWRATSIDVAATSEWGIGFLTPDGFAGVRQSDRSLDDLLTTYVDEDTSELPAVSPDGELGGRWQAFRDRGGDRAYASEVAGQTLLVYGSAPESELLDLAGRLTTEPVQR